MVSIGPNSQSYNFTHMFDITDLRGNLPVLTYCKNSISGFLFANKEFSKMFALLKKAKLDGQYNQSQADVTLFVCPDKYMKLNPENASISQARTFILTCSLNRRIPMELIEDSPAAYYDTKAEQCNRLFISNMNNRTYISNPNSRNGQLCPGKNIQVIHEDILCSNGIIHLVDGVITPEFL